MSRPSRPLRWLLPLLSGCAGLLLAGLLLQGAWESPLLIAAALGALALPLLRVGLGSGRRLLIGLFFLSAAFDISKAIVPPLDRFYSPGLYLTPAHLLLLAWALVWGIGERARRREALPLTGLDRAALGFLLLIWWAALRAPAGLLALASAVAYSLAVLAFYVVSHALRSAADVRLAVQAVLTGFVLQAAVTAAQMVKRGPIEIPGIKVSDLSAMTVGLGGGSAFRPFGLFNHPNVMADYVLWLLLPAAAVWLLGAGRLRPAVRQGALAVALAAAAMLLASLSRGGWAAAVLGAVVAATMMARRGLLGRRHAIAALLLLIAAAGTVAVVYPEVFLRLTEPDGRSTESRLLLNDQAFMIIAHHPWLGVGLGGYNEAAQAHIPASWADISPDYQRALSHLVVHNSYLLTAAELGLPGALAWALLLLAMLRQAWPLAQWRQPGTFALAAGLAGALAAHLLYLASDNYYVDIRIFLLWLAAGVLQALRLQAQGAARITR
ncbi:O-antigen ligase-like membrane protein [Sphaerotilus hippei]|uniref:O-antigen ligase-like membrane protein n=1 Tax=Sphaerotilus hippei TaxID=744406 RepID=A0A318H076_9BURK|nr:O-antigen ligase family protein [Sphaerotilus hippei]PXW96199.1 O-antigen ligase-like membrane protein [Sphaerotilus hippei]